MKRTVLIVLACLFVVAGVGVAEQLESKVDMSISTYNVTGDAYIADDTRLLISSATRRTLIKEIEISNLTAEHVAQTVTLYDNFSSNGSSANVTAIWTVTIGSGTSGGNDWTYSKTFADGDRGFLKADYGLAARKSSTNGVVSISIQYK